MRTVRVLGAHGRNDFDLVLAALGFEERSSHLAASGRIHGQSLHALGFDGQQELSFESNLDAFQEYGYTPQVVSDEDFGGAFGEILKEVGSSSLSDLRVAIDISSLTRFRLGTLIDVLRFGDSAKTVWVSFFYSLAKYDPPPTAQPPNRYVGPVTPHYAGWSALPEGPQSTIVGLGYERDRAVGALEQLQSRDEWVFFPQSPISEYDEQITLMNRNLLDVLAPESILQYPVMDPLFTFAVLESLAGRCSRQGGCVIFPFGPKVFALAALLVGAIHEDVAVWRVSPGDLTPPVDRVASGLVTKLNVSFDAER